MDEFSSSLIELWKEWNVRVAVLLSFTLQVVLILFSNCRKHNSKLWIRIVTWCAYLSADFVATYALGVITNNISHLHEKNCEYTGANTELTAFWAPFLLMHLGGPDTITAYSLEDNELWLRHFLGLVVQTVMAIYVGVMAWTGSLLSFLSLLMLLAGLIKYGERTWVLRKASVEEIRDSYADLNLSHVLSTAGDVSDSVNHYLLSAYNLMDICFQPLLLDQSSVFNVLERAGFVELFESSKEDAYLFPIIEVSVAFMYDNLYTKALLLYTKVGLGLRVITIVLTSSTSVLFPVLVNKYKFSKIDVTITFVLLFGAIVLEIYSALLLLFSDRFQVWLIKHPKCLKMFEAFKGVVPKKKRWSNKMSQFSLLSFIMKEKTMPCSNFLKHFSIVQNLENQWYAADIEVPNDLKKTVFNYLKTRGRRPITSPIDEYDELQLRSIDLTQEIDKSILAWHVATEKWYEMDREHIKAKEHDIELICQISRYMFSLLVLHPNMVSNANTTKLILRPILVAARHSSFASRIAACQELLGDIKSKIGDMTKFDARVFDFFNKYLPWLLQILDESGEARWTMIRTAWLEMLVYAACKCRGMQHGHRLKCGGEFLTHVWLLTKCFGLTEFDILEEADKWASYIFVRSSVFPSPGLVGTNESDISCSEI